MKAEYNSQQRRQYQECLDEQLTITRTFARYLGVASPHSRPGHWVGTFPQLHPLMKQLGEYPSLMKCVVNRSHEVGLSYFVLECKSEKRSSFPLHLPHLTARHERMHCCNSMMPLYPTWHLDPGNVCLPVYFLSPFQILLKTSSCHATPNDF